MLTYDSYIKPLLEATEAVEKVSGREEAYKFAMGSLDQTQKQLNNSIVAKIISFIKK